MPRNLEYKAKVRELKSLEGIFIDHGGVFVEMLYQTDTYFCVHKGRLKVREVTGKNPELIFYERNETSADGMQSIYEIVRLSDLLIKDFLIEALGIKVVVEKERRLLKIKNARIHLDLVKDLGEFLEFEVVSEGDDVGDAELLERLKKLAKPYVLEEKNLSYSDLVSPY